MAQNQTNGDWQQQMHTWNFQKTKQVHVKVNPHLSTCGACIRHMCPLLHKLPLGWISMCCVQRWIQKLVQSGFWVIPEETTVWLDIVNGGTGEEMTTIRTIMEKQKEERKMLLCSLQDFCCFPLTIPVGHLLGCNIPSVSFFKAHTVNHAFECECVSQTEKANLNWILMLLIIWPLGSEQGGSNYENIASSVVFHMLCFLISVLGFSQLWGECPTVLLFP